METERWRGKCNSDGEDSLSLPHYEPYDTGITKRKKIAKKTELGSKRQTRSVSVLVRDWEKTKSNSKESHCIVRNFQKDNMKKVAKIASCERPKDHFWCMPLSSCKETGKVKMLKNIAPDWQKDVLSEEDDDWSTTTGDHNDLISLPWNPTDNGPEDDMGVPTVITCRKCVLLARQWHKEAEMTQGNEQMEDLTTSTVENTEIMIHPWNSPLRSDFTEHVPNFVTCCKKVLPFSQRMVESVKKN